MIRSARVLKLAIVLTVLFNLLALATLINPSPILFAVVMFVGQPLFGIALILLIAAILLDLRTRGML